MGCVRSLCYALNAARRRREEGIEEWRPGVNPFLGRGIRPLVPRFVHWERVPGNNNNVNMAWGRSRSFPAPPQPNIRKQPHSQPCCLMAGFGYVTPNPNSHLASTPSPMFLTCLVIAGIVALAISHPFHPFPQIILIPKVPPQSLLTLRMVTLSLQIVAALKLLFLVNIFFLLF